MGLEKIIITMPKWKKDKIKVHADCMGESVNRYINRIIDEDMAGMKEACDQAMDALKEAEAALKEMSKDCTDCHNYWQNTDTENECNGQDKICHEFAEMEK